MKSNGDGNEKKVQAQARRTARKMLEPALEEWGTTQRVRVFRQSDGRVMINRGGADGVNISFHPARMRKDDVSVLLRILVDLLDEQATIAEFSLPFAQFDVSTAKARTEGAADGARRSTKPARMEIERLIGLALDRGEECADKFGAWATEYGYTTRQLRNIAAAVEKKRTKKTGKSLT